jgi:hypothetical protein
MRNSGLLLLISLVLFLPALAAEPAPPQPISVAQLEQILSAPNQSDRNLARRLSELLLTNRLSSERFERLNAALPGRRSYEALLILSDLSQFLDPPVTEIVPTYPPDSTARVQIFNRAIAFVSGAMHNMPNFLADREITRFQSRKRLRDTGQSILVEDTPFRSVDHSQAKVIYRDGTEIVENNAAKTRHEGLTSWGEFGPLLGIITKDMMKGTVTFKHWERSSGGALAVFDFSVAKEQSHNIVSYCCGRPGDADGRSFQLQPSYHGRIVIDPSTGSILRLVVLADLGPSDPITRADVAIEYGPIQLGGKAYIAPLRSITVSESASVTGQAQPSLAHAEGASNDANFFGITALNHTEFEDYHLFRGDLRILPDP